ncbi:hypothetical protein [Sphaerisporangium corydalis]|uniref:Uncharacterized protein n=1 Tax=Sphaerisporangium corydalis TaxID=1441875 RepID=A0ABV9ESJ1_9ACTN|nr:hypothetical protein [Sphaerisporangium corydalis]
MDGFFVDYSGLKDLHQDYSARQPDVNGFFRTFEELHPRPEDFPEAAGDSRLRIDEQSAQAVTAAGLLSAGHPGTTLKVQTMAYRYGQAEDATTGATTTLAEGPGAVPAVLAEGPGEDEQRPLAPRLGADMVQISALIGSVAGYYRGARLGGSALMSVGGLVGSGLVTLAATIIVQDNVRDPDVWAQRGRAAAQLRDGLTEHADGVHHAAGVSGENLKGEAGDTFRGFVATDVVAPNRTLADAAGEISLYSLAAGDAQKTFNDRITVGSGLATLASAPAAYLYPPLQVSVAILWLMYVMHCRDDLRSGYAAAAGHLSRTGELSTVNAKLRGGTGTGGAPATVTI